MSENMKLTPEQYKLLLAYADCDMSIRAAAKKEYMSVPTVNNWFKKIEDSTGLKPTRFWNLIQLLEESKVG